MEIHFWRRSRERGNVWDWNVCVKCGDEDACMRVKRMIKRWEENSVYVYVRVSSVGSIMRAKVWERVALSSLL